MNPDVRICSCLKITLFKPQLVCATDKDSIGYHEIKEEQTTNVFYSVTQKIKQAQFKTVGFRLNAPASPKSPLLCVVLTGSQDILLLPRKMVLESEFSEIGNMSRLTQKSEIQYS